MIKPNYRPDSTACVKLREALATLNCSFIWRNTPQGHNYWLQVTDNLDNLTADPKNHDCDLSFLSRGQKERLKKLLSQ